VGTGTVTVLGASGKTGRAVVAAALQRGLTVRATSRDPGRRCAAAAGRLSWHRADVVTGEGLTEALSGADAAYLVVPNVHPAEVEAVVHAGRVATEVGVGRLLYHSVADPHDRRMAHHLRKGEAERRLRAVRPDTVVLRPCAYQQNLLPGALAGSLQVPYRLSAPFSLVDLEDVAEVAAAGLAGALEPGTTHDLGGPEQLSVRQLARVALAVLDRPVSVSSLTPQQWRSGPGSGVDGSALEDLLAMFAAYDESGFVVDPAPLARVLGRPPTTWAQLLTKESA
jgi:NAD(P)H dehydrogenase (quinone)